jgi:hypothetical protein
MNIPACITRLFDLNIEKILEGWELCHAARELISNALDEQPLSSTTEIAIEGVSESTWKIRDYGRGLRHEHLIQKENGGKLDNSGKSDRALRGRVEGYGWLTLAPWRRGSYPVTIREHRALRRSLSNRLDRSDILRFL